MSQKTFLRKIAYIVPSMSVAQVVQNALSEEIAEGWIDIVLLESDAFGAEYKRISEIGYGAIIARGGTYRELVSVAGVIPIVEERVRSADLLQMAADHFATQDEPLHFLIQQDIANGFENLAVLMPERIKVERYTTTEDQQCRLQNVSSGVTVVTGGLAERHVNRMDIRIVPVRIRDFSIKHTAIAARNMMRKMEDSITKVNTINSIYNNVDEGILIFKPDYTVVEINARAELLLRLKSREAIGMDVHELIPSMPPRKNDGSCSVDTPTTLMIEVGSKKLSVSIYPFKSFHESVRYMIILQDITRIQEAERKIRMEMSKKGLVAERTFDDIITVDPNMLRVVDRAKRVSKFDGSVLIYGESGTGKELFAQSIHNASERHNGPFVAINCGALTESLLESELFGYVGGSFTGARKEGKAGLFELAHNGTIFLDEINSTSISMQTKILRVIEEQEVMRVGSDYMIPLDIRVISASNANLGQNVVEGTFRRDLFYRLNTFQIGLPPIRERKKDIVLLFKDYLKKYLGRDEKLDPEFEEQLIAHNWLGNVREIRSIALRYNAFDGDNRYGDILNVNQEMLENVDEMESVVTTQAMMEEGTPARTQLVQPSSTFHESTEDISVSLGELSRVVEQLVIESLEGRGLSKAEIAKELGISRQALYKKLKK